MVFSSSEELGPVDEPLRVRDLGLRGDRAAVETLIVHDSFYRAIEPQILDAFPDPVTMLIFDQSERVSAKGLSADRLIINVVERKFLLDRDLLTWDEDIPFAVLNRNMQRAQDCGAYDIADAAIGGGKPAKREVAIRAVAPSHLPCLRLSVTARDSATLAIALPDPETGTYEPGRALEYGIEPGTRTVAFVLPAYAAGSSIQLSLDGTGKAAFISAVEVGAIFSLPRPTSAVDTPTQP